MGIDKNVGVMFACLFVGYTFIVYLRTTVSFAAPVIIKEEKMENSDLGMVLTGQMMGYTFMKLIGGTLVDKFNPGFTFAASLGLSGVIGIVFTCFSSVPTWVSLWFLIGLILGPSWGACGLLVKRNLPADQLATWWSILSSSMNVAGTMGPFLSTAIISLYSWRTTLLFGGLINIVLGILCFAFFYHSPSLSRKKDVATPVTESSGEKSVLLNPVLLSLCANYLLVSVVRGASSDWGQLYLIQSKGQSLTTGSSYMSSKEVGGILGSFVAGYVSDLLISKRTGSSPLPRMWLLGVLTAVQSAATACFLCTVSAQSSQAWISLLGFVMGFGIYGTISLLGVTSMEVSPDNLAGTAHSMAAFGGNLGQVFAGYPLSLLATWMSWNECFQVVTAVSVLSVLMSCVSVHLYSRTLDTELKKKKT